MAFNLGKQKKAISDINVTPLVDVMLVLLVIFMISAPLLFNGVELKLPKTQKTKPVQLKEEQIVVSITREQKIYLGEIEVNQKTLLTKLSQKLSSPEELVFLRADTQIPYGNVADVLSLLRKNGIVNLALITEGTK